MTITIFWLFLLNLSVKLVTKKYLLAIRDHPIAMFHIVAGRGSGIVPET